MAQLKLPVPRGVLQREDEPDIICVSVALNGFFVTLDVSNA